MNEIPSLIKISNYAGERFDLVQAGGGNSSVKYDTGEMLIKASGCTLSEVDINKGYSKVDNLKIKNIVEEDKLETLEKREAESYVAALIKEATLDTNNRPSIETLLHSLLSKYTLHTHPIVVNMIVALVNWRELLSTIFQDDEIILVEYKTPGIELALALNSELKVEKRGNYIIFLQNHGLIVSSNNEGEIIRLTEYVLEKVERYLNIDMSHYKIVTELTSFYNSIYDSSEISYLSEDAILNDKIISNKSLFFAPPFAPDALVYCGRKILELQNLQDKEPLKNYLESYHVMPKIILFDNKIFIRAINIKKAKEIEEVLKFHIMVLENQGEFNFLDNKELNYLSNWEAEKYRANL